MIRLPGGVAIYENVAAEQYEGPAVLELLKDSELTGFARYVFRQATAVLVFESGRLCGLHLESGDTRVGASRPFPGSSTSS